MSEEVLESKSPPPSPKGGGEVPHSPGEPPPRRRTGWAHLIHPAMIVALVAIGLSVWMLVDMRHRLGNLEDDLGRKLAQFNVTNQESRVLAHQAQENVRAMEAKLVLLENRLAESQNQQVALEALYQELSRSRDEWALADIEQTLSIASQQLQLSGNVKAALIAMQTADNRLQRLDKPQFIALRKVISRDIEKLKSLPFVDTVGISLRLDHLIAAVDSLPLALEVAQKRPRPVDGPAADQRWWVQFGREAWKDLKQLVQIRKMDQGEIPLLPPDQAYFVRENLKLRLLTARLALLQRDEQSYKADLRAAAEWIRRYFDADSKAAQAALESINQLASNQINIELPDISDSLDTVRNYKLGQERGQR